MKGLWNISQVWSLRAEFHSLRWFNEPSKDSISILNSLCSCIRTQGAVDNKSCYLCGPQAGIPAAWEDASGSCRPRGFQPPCCLAHNRRVHQTHRDRNHLSLCLQTPNQCRSSSIGDLVMGFRWKQNHLFLFSAAERLSAHGWGRKEETEDYRHTFRAQAKKKWGQEIQLTDVSHRNILPISYKTVITLIIWPGTKGSSSAAVS